jgi:putative ABC transport system permease protein
MRTGFSWLDFRLGFRMLLKYPGLTLVGGLAMAFAIWVGAATFEFVTQVLRPTLPLEEGHRIVGLRSWDAAAGREERRTTRDFLAWSEELSTVEELGAYRPLSRNLIAADGPGAPLSVAGMSASGFRIARVAPLLGRYLTEADEQPGAQAVVVLGHDIWKSRFGADPGVIGQTVRLGGSQSTVVGVMPEGFTFPVNHSLWVPLNLSAVEHGPREGPEIRVFGRLAAGASLQKARAELTTLGTRAAAHFPATHEHLRPQVMPYANMILPMSGEETAGLVSLNLFFMLLLVLVCGNVALLLFARAATREAEIAVRSALGASRGRIMGQLFAEALVLAGIAAVVGLAAAGFGLRWGLGVLEGEVGQLAFWFRDSLSPATVLYALLLTLLCALIAGVVPAIKVTRGVGPRLRQTSGGRGGFRFGGVWTAVIVAQVAVTVTFPAFGFFVRRDAGQVRAVEVGFPAEEWLAVQLEMDRETGVDVPGDVSQQDFLARFRTAYAELERRLASEAAVAGVTYGDRLPRMYHRARFVEVDGGGAAPQDPRRGSGYRVGRAFVDPDFFAALGTGTDSGRGFHSGDAETDARAVIVNRSFAKLVLGGRNPIGRRVRYLDHGEDAGSGSTEEERGPWYEIVGVVRDMGFAEEPDPKVAGIYHATKPENAYPISMAVHVNGDPEAFAPRLREIAAAVDPTLRLSTLMRLDRVNEAELRSLAFIFQLVVLVSGVALLLSLAGIYAVMAFTVSQRTREIGIRVALGASSRSVVAVIFRRPLAQVGIGIAAGGALTAVIAYLILDGAVSPLQGGLVAGYASLMMGVCMLACIVPTRRALRVEPTEAMRADV